MECLAGRGSVPESQYEEANITMKNRKSRITIACAAAALAALLGMSALLTVPVRAQEQPAETVCANRLSDVEDGYDVGASRIFYEIDAPAF